MNSAIELYTVWKTTQLDFSKFAFLRLVHSYLFCLPWASDRWLKANFYDQLFYSIFTSSQSQV